MHKIQVLVKGIEVLYDPAEERNYRVVIAPETVSQKIDVELVRAIAEPFLSPS